MERLVNWFRRVRFGTPWSLQEEISPRELVFVSFTTLTTVRYGDIVPRHGMAKSIVVLESLNRAMRSAEKLMERGGTEPRQAFDMLFGHRESWFAIRRASSSCECREIHERDQPSEKS